MLATSLGMGERPAQTVVGIYRQRMQIEEGFRDMKSERFGLGLNHQHCRSRQRLSMLVLLTTLACWLAMLLGLLSTVANRQRQYQVNTGRQGALSLFYRLENPR